MPTRLRRQEVDQMFSPQQVTPRDIATDLSEVEITPDLRRRVEVRDVDRPGERAETVAGFQTGARGQALREGAGRLRDTAGRIVRGAGRTATRIGQELAQPEMQQFLGQIGEAFGQGDPTSPATILGGHAQANVQQQADAQIMSRLLAGEDPAQIDEQTLALASPEAREQALLTVEQRAERELSEEELEIRRQQIERSHELEERGLDLRRFGLDTQRMQTEAAIDADETERRLAVAEENAAIQRDATESLIEFRRAQISVMEREADEEAAGIDQAEINRRRGDLINTLSSGIESEEERLQILQSDYDRLPEGRPEAGRFGTLIHQLEQTAHGEPVDVDAIREMREPVDTEDRVEMRGRIEEARDEISQMRQHLQQLTQDQIRALETAAPTQRTPTTLPDGEQQQQLLREREGLPEVDQIATPNTRADYDALPDGAVYRYGDGIFRKRGDQQTDEEVTDFYQGQAGGGLPDPVDSEEIEPEGN